MFLKEIIARYKIPYRYRGRDAITGRYGQLFIRNGAVFVEFTDSALHPPITTLKRDYAIKALRRTRGLINVELRGHGFLAEIKPGKPDPIGVALKHVIQALRGGRKRNYRGKPLLWQPEVSASPAIQTGSKENIQTELCWPCVIPDAVLPGAGIEGLV